MASYLNHYMTSCLSVRQPNPLVIITVVSPLYSVSSKASSCRIIEVVPSNDSLGSPKRPRNFLIVVTTTLQPWRCDWKLWSKWNLNLPGTSIEIRPDEACDEGDTGFQNWHMKECESDNRIIWDCLTDHWESELAFVLKKIVESWFWLTKSMLLSSPHLQKCLPVFTKKCERVLHWVHCRGSIDAELSQNSHEDGSPRNCQKRKPEAGPRRLFVLNKLIAVSPSARPKLTCVRTFTGHISRLPLLPKCSYHSKLSPIVSPNWGRKSACSRLEATGTHWSLLWGDFQYDSEVPSSSGRWYRTGGQFWI